MWLLAGTLTTASNTMNVSFKGRGSVFIEGTFGGGAVGVHPRYRAINDSRAPLSTTTAFLDDAIDGTTVKSLGVPSGDYVLDLAGSTGASVSVYINDQKELTHD